MDMRIAAWDSQPRRDLFVKDLEELFKVYGNPFQKDSREIEHRIFEKSRNEVEYRALAHRLLRHINDSKLKKSTKEENLLERKFKRKLSPAHKAPKRPLAPLIVPNEVPGSPEVQPISPSFFAYPGLEFETVKLPRGNEWTYLIPTKTPFLASPQTKDAPRLLTQMVRDGILLAESDDNLCMETYETTVRLQVPVNSVIRQVTVFLERTR